MSTDPPPMAYLEPTQSAGRALWQRGIVGPVVMLNLLRFRAVADYSHAPELAPSSPISGAEAFDRYITLTLPFLQASGGELVRQSGIEMFMRFATDPGYTPGLPHRSPGGLPPAAADRERPLR